MKRYIITFAILITALVVCLFLSFKYEHDADSYGVGVSVTHIKHLGYDTLTISQIDSLVMADTLPAFNKWTKTYIKDAENNKTYEYRLLYDLNSGITYTVKELSKNKYVLQKRRTKTVKK